MRSIKRQAAASALTGLASTLGGLMDETGALQVWGGCLGRGGWGPEAGSERGARGEVRSKGIIWIQIILTCIQIQTIFHAVAREIVHAWNSATFSPSSTLCCCSLLQLSTVDKLFSSLDVNNDGTISVNELSSLVVGLSMASPTSTLDDEILYWYAAVYL